MDKLTKFSLLTGLQVNPSKCQLYCGGIEEDDISNIEKITGFSRGKLPFKYLGIPQTSRKLSISQCMALVEKKGDKMKHWSSHLLSYAGRVQLVNNVVFVCVNYWMSCLPMPKGAIKRSEAMCRSYVWFGTDRITRKAPVVWEKVCAPKKNGGLGIINLQIWNKVCLSRLMWNLSSKVVLCGCTGSILIMLKMMRS